MDEHKTLELSTSCSPSSVTPNGSYISDGMSDLTSGSLCHNLQYTDADRREGCVVVGANSISSEQARTEELKLLNKESVKMSPFEHSSGINENTSPKYQTETRRYHHPESMDYLQRPFSSQKAKEEHQARMDELKLLKLGTVTRQKRLFCTPGDKLSELSPNIVEEGRKKMHFLESIDYLHNPSSSQQAKLEQEARMKELTLLKLNGITKLKSHLTPTEGITDIDSFHSSLKSLKESRKKQHLESLEYLHRYQNNEVSSEKKRSRQVDHHAVITPSPSQGSISEGALNNMECDGTDSSSSEASDSGVEIDCFKLNVLESGSLNANTSDGLGTGKNRSDGDLMDSAVTSMVSATPNTKECGHGHIITSDEDSFSNNTNSKELCVNGHDPQVTEQAPPIAMTKEDRPVDFLRSSENSLVNKNSQICDKPSHDIPSGKGNTLTKNTNPRPSSRRSKRRFEIYV